jgi:integrase
MARTVRDAKLETRTARAALKPSGKPYYRSIDEGLHLGYRRGQSGGKWVMRRYVGEQSYAVETIGVADDKIDPDGVAVLSFGQAQAEARKRFVEAKRLAAGTPAEGGRYTVRAAVSDYLAWLEQNRKTARDARWRAEALILPELGPLACPKLTTLRIRDWRDGLAATAPRLRTKSGHRQRHRALDTNDPDEAARRRRATANRTLTILKAALNHAWREHKILSDEAWRPVKAFAEADAARARYLTLAECARLINASDQDFRKLVQAALQTGCRFGELAALTVADFHPDSGTLHVRTSKTGKGRHVVLTEEGVTLFRGMAAGQSPHARLLSKADGGRWLKSHQTRPMKETCIRATIEPPANFHVLRHTYASLTIMNGAPLMVVARNLGHTDTRMVEKHYGHLAPGYVAEQIRAAAPRFGINSDSTKVISIGSTR